MENYNHKGVIAWFAKNSVAANLLLFSVIILGIIQASNLRIESFPSIEPDRVTVSVSYRSGDPKQSEEGIAMKIEDALESVSGIKRITSSSTANGASIVIEKESSYHLDTLLDDIKTNVDAINNLPSDADKPVIEKDKRRDHAIYVQLYGDADRKALQDLADNLKTDLLQKKNISKAEISSKLDPYISIEVDKMMLQKYGITLSDINSAINAESSSALTTSLRNENKVVRLKVSEQKYSVDEFKKIPVLSLSNGAVIRVGDVATITESFDEDSFSLSRYNGKNGIAVQITMGDDGDVSKISEQANEVVADWKSRNVLPDGIQITTWDDQSEMIKSRLDLLIYNGLTGILAVFLVLAIFLNVTVAFWVAAGLPFVFFGTLLLMGESFFNLTINSMTTFGFIMALGIVVDDAVVVGESIYTERRKHGDTLSNAISGTMKVAVPTIFGVLTTVSAFSALTGIEGGMGKIFAQFAVVVSICLMLSLVESKFILPSHLSHINTQRNSKGLWSKVQNGADYLLNGFNEKIYKRVIEFSLNNKYAVIILFVSTLLAIGSMPFKGVVKTSFFPDIPMDTVRASLVMTEDSSFGKTHENMLTLEKSAISIANKLNGSEIDNGIESMSVVASSDTSGSVKITFSDSAKYTASDFSKAWNADVDKLEGAKKLDIVSRMEMVSNFKMELRSSDSDIAVKAGNDTVDFIKGIRGVNSTEDNLSQVNSQYVFELTPQGRALGVTTSDLSSYVLQTFGGGKTQKFQKGQNEVTVSVRYPEESRKTLTNIMNSSVRMSDGTLVPFSVLGSVKATYQTSSITRIDNLRAIYASATVDKDVITSNELVNLVKKDLVPVLEQKYPHLKISFAGEAEQQAETMASMELMAVAAIIAIYALLAIPLKSYIQPLVIMTAIPFGIVGAILGHYITGLTISILSLFGIMALSGVVVNDSLLLVSRYNDLKEEGMNTHDAIVESCTSRLRAVLLTSLTTFAGLVPLLSETSLQSQFLKPAAASLGYGIVFATIITLILIPALVKVIDDIKSFKFRSKALNESEA